MNDYLKDKTRILVTHSISHLQSVDKIVLLEKVSVLLYKTLKRRKNNPKNFKGKIVKEGSINEFHDQQNSYLINDDLSYDVISNEEETTNINLFDEIYNIKVSFSFDFIKYL